MSLPSGRHFLRCSNKYKGQFVQVFRGRRAFVPDDDRGFLSHRFVTALANRDDFAA